MDTRTMSIRQAAAPSTPARSAVRLPMRTSPPALPSPPRRAGAKQTSRPMNRYGRAQPTTRPPPNNNGDPASPSRPVVRQRIPWANEKEASFYVREAPPNFSTRDFYRLLVPYGKVVYIEILVSQREDRTDAEVKFRPPPETVEWFINGIDIAKNDMTYHVRFGRKETRPWLHASPIDPGRKFHEEIKVTAIELSFGVMQEQDSMQRLKVIGASTSASIELVMNLQRKCIDVSFPVAVAQNETTQYQRNYKIRLNFPQIREVVKMHHGPTGQYALFITVDQPPQVFREASDISETHEVGATMWSEWHTWYRQAEIVRDPGAAKLATTQLRKAMPVVDIGRWLTYRVVLSKATGASHDFQEFCLALSHHNIDIERDRTIAAPIGEHEALWRWIGSPNEVLGQTSAVSDLHMLAEDITQFDFNIRYQLEVCTSRGVIHESNIDDAFLARLAKLEKLRAVKLLEKVADEKKRFWDTNDIFRQLLAQISVVQKTVPSHRALVHSAVVTPTTIYFATPIIETSNRVLRQYSQYADRFLRLKFTDELYKGGIRSFDDASMNEVFTRIKRTMASGIKVGGRHFEFLAFGNSQFREGGAWFFASIGDVTAQSIRDWMGDFTNIKVVAKYCSRVGQCFSTTTALRIGEVNVVTIPDIVRNGHTFSDGVGKISPFLAQMIAQQYNMPNFIAEYPSMFQFRLGGSKGVLTVDPSLKWKEVHIRPSQEKFPSKNHADLNICRISQFSTANLNIQIILVLSALGVTDDVFLRKMRHELSGLHEAMHNSDKAMEMFCRNVDFNQMTLQLASMVDDGFMDVEDPFMISCIRLWHSWTVKYLKEKAKIPVQKGAFVLGCVDETSTLRGHSAANEGSASQNIADLPQIFIQIPDPDQKGHWKIITGVCTLARNPSLHPGDVRVVCAVNVPQLRHLRNCVVLPQVGDRDLASMCSGGDLDGDDYLVMWDEDLLPVEWNHPPMNYDPPPPKIATGPVTVDDMTSFFVTHMKHDNLRPIAVAHKYWADWLQLGVKDPICLQLAQLHSMAVDYAKTGVPAQMPKALRVKGWPHWAEAKNKSKRRIYTSHKVIGKLYNMVQRINFHPAWDNPFDKRILEAFELDDALLQAAGEVKQEYDAAIRRNMAKFGIKSDFEIFTTFALEHSDDFGDYKFAETLGDVVGALKDHFQKVCYEKAGTSEKERDWEKMSRFIAAMYTITAQEVEAALVECEQRQLKGGRLVPVKVATTENMPFMSFPWLFAAELGRIANKGRNMRRDSLSQALKLPRKPTKKMPVLDLGDNFELEPLQEVSFDTKTETNHGSESIDVSASMARDPNGSSELAGLTTFEAASNTSSRDVSSAQGSPSASSSSSSEGLTVEQPTSGTALHALGFASGVGLLPAPSQASFSRPDTSASEFAALHTAASAETEITILSPSPQTPMLAPTINEEDHPSFSRTAATPPFSNSESDDAGADIDEKAQEIVFSDTSSPETEHTVASDEEEEVGEQVVVTFNSNTPSALEALENLISS